MFYQKPLFMKAINAPIQRADHTLLFATVFFVLGIMVALGLTIIFRKQLRKSVNLRITLPIIGFLLLIIPFAEDYINLVGKGQIDNFFTTYLSSNNIFAKLVIYFVAFSFIARNKQSISASTPLALVVLVVAIASKDESTYTFNVIEYAAVLSALLFVIVIAKQRYSFINFIESIMIMSIMVFAVVSTKIATSANVKAVESLPAATFNMFYTYDGSWIQVLSWFSVVVAAQFAYLFLSTKFTFKLNVKDTISFIRLEDKYRKANIEFNFETKDDLSVDVLLQETDRVDFETDVLFKEEFEEIEFSQHAKLQKIYLKSKGIRSPSF